MIDYILNLDSVLKPNQQKNKSKFIDDEEEDGKIDNSNPFIDNNTRERQVVDKNLLELNEYQESHPDGNFESRVMSSPRSSFPNYVNEKLETKQGWLYKRSFKFPNFIGWQRRYCQIKGQKLMYYKNSDMKKLDGVIDFNLLTCLITVPKEAVEDGIPGKYNISKLGYFYKYSLFA